ncbi:MAG: putative glycoside hydrolase, partial [Planctomycetota bacterium]
MNGRIGWMTGWVLLTASLAAGGDAGPVLDDARKGPPYPRIANCYGARLGHWTRPETLKVLAKFDLLIGGVNAGSNDKQRRAVTDMVAKLRAGNPHLIVLDFSSSAPYAASWQVKVTPFPDDGWLLSPDGKTIEGWPGTKMINLSKRSVIDWLARRSAASASKPVFDGTFIDCMGGGFDHWACNIKSGEPYEIDADGDGQADSDRTLNRKWRQAKQILGRTVRTRIGPKAVFMANQAHEANFSQLNGILLEDFLDYVLDDGRSWRQVLDHYFHWTQTPHRPTVTTIVSSSGLEPAFNAWKNMTEADRNAILTKGKALTRRMRFGLATTLMGDGYYAYDLHTRWRGQHWWYPEYDAPLGYPTGPSREFADGTWRRSFDGGMAVINPTCLDLLVKPGRRSRDVSSGKVGEEFLIPAQDGRILVPTSDAPAQPRLPDPAPAFTRRGPGRIARRDGRVLWRMDDRTCAVFR